MALKRLTITHDFAVDADKRVDLADIGRENIFSCQLIWSGLTGTLDGVIKAQGSNANPAANNFDDLGIQKTLNSASDSHTLIDGEFAFEHGAVDIKKNGLTGGTLILNFLAKQK